MSALSKQKILIVLRDIKTDRYHLYVLHSIKDIETNTLISLSLQDNPHSNVIWSELQSLFKRKNNYDYLISNVQDIKQKYPSLIHYDYFSKNEHRITARYLDNKRKFKSLHGNIQHLNLENGIILDEVKDKKSYKLDILEIKSLTWAFLFANDYLHINNSAQLLRMY